MTTDSKKERPGADAARFVQTSWAPARAVREGLSWERLAGDGSDREFFRVKAEADTAVVIYGPDRAENRSYELIGRHLWEIGRAGPELLAVDHELGLFLMEDLGATLLFDLAALKGCEELEGVYRKVVRLLADVHQSGLEGFDPAWCFQTPCYDRALILEREAGYFLEAFVLGYMKKRAGGAVLAAEFEALADAALAGSGRVLMHRDFQSRNVMIKQGCPRLVDFQGARSGPPGYDLASLLYDPYAGLDDELKVRLKKYYLERRGSGFDAASFLKTYPALAVCRLLQTLGAFGFLIRVKGKPFFEPYIPRALDFLDRLLGSESFDFLPELRSLVRAVRSEFKQGL